jgi:hypothetical protein
MKNALNLSLYESIIRSEFNLVTASKDSLTALDISLSAKELKQCIKALNFFCVLNNTHENKKITFLLPKKVDALFGQHYLKTFNVDGVEIVRRYRHDLLQDRGFTPLFISNNGIKSETILKNLVFNKVCLVLAISLEKVLKDSSFYQVYNVLDSNKKLIFFLILLETLLKKKR